MIPAAAGAVRGPDARDGPGECGAGSGSGVPGVLLYGMPGGGKTACATELAYTHEHAFDRLVWFKAPDEGQDITGALTDFALTLERGCRGSRWCTCWPMRRAWPGSCRS